MKKRTAAALIAAMLAVSATGCSKVDEVTKIADNNSSSATETEDPAVKETDTKTGKPKKESTEKLERNKNKDKENSIKEVEESQKEEDRREQENNENEDEEYENGENEDSEDYQQEDGETYYEAESLYDEAVDMYVEMVINNPYELDYSNGTDDGYYPIIGADSIDEIYGRYQSVFSSSDDLQSKGKYKEIDGVPYCRDGGRGFDITYTGTDLELVSESDTEATYNAVSHYQDPDTGQALDDVTANFTIVKTDGEWKVSDFSVPG